ncbi:hypothetical protein LJR235_000091 [Pararhizobium sp. LjRoot235]|uniref:hypothetical protein n=1 Tax=Pararhizobium sp. LjRoot235 TaxID=3342291 RepID=UPI003ED07A11
MLTPILTVKTSAATGQTAAAVEAVTPKEQRTHAEPVRISGSQSEAVLKVLETLNRHLVGSEPLPKEALIRLLDTLAKVLKFPPLPQETVRDFSKRLAVFLETLPPAARLALEKQLGQRDLAISIRILAEALKGPSIIDAPRLLETFFTPATVARPATGQPEGRPAATGTMPPETGTGRPTAQPQSAAPATVSDSGMLQAVLKKAFGDEGETTAPAVVAEEGEGGEQTAESQTPRGSDTAAAGAQRLAKANSETIPLLRAAAAFLAADSEALSLVAAIATGDIDSQTKADLEQELGFDLSEQTGQIETPQQPIQAESFAAEGAQEPTSGTATGENTASSETGSASRQAAPAVADLLPATAAEPDVRTEIIQSADMQPHRGEVEDFKGDGPGEWDLHTELEERPFAPVAEAQSAAFEAETSRPEKMLVETLKTLVEASLPMPEGSAGTGPQTLFAALAGETADMGAEALFAELQTADDIELPPDTALTTGGFAEQPELEADTWSALLDPPEEKAPRRPTHPSALDEGGREAQIPRPPETGIARDAIPFAMIPYLPTKTVETRSVKEEEEQPSFAEDEQRDERGESNDQGHENEHHAAGNEVASQEDETATADAYDVYKRMGGLV